MRGWHLGLAAFVHAPQACFVVASPRQAYMQRPFPPLYVDPSLRYRALLRATATGTLQPSACLWRTGTAWRSARCAGQQGGLYAVPGLLPRAGRRVTLASRVALSTQAVAAWLTLPLPSPSPPWHTSSFSSHPSSAPTPAVVCQQHGPAPCLCWTPSSISSLPSTICFSYCAAVVCQEYGPVRPARGLLEHRVRGRQGG